MDYSLLVGKGRNSNAKQNGRQKDNAIIEVKSNDDNGSSDERISTARGESSSLTEGKIIESAIHSTCNVISDSKTVKSNLASMECTLESGEGKGNKLVRRQIVANVQDNRMGSMMPVVLEQVVDNTKSKLTGKRITHMPNMVGDGMNPLNLAMEIDEKTNKTSVVGKQGKTNRMKRQPKNVPKVDSDLKIVAELSGDSDG